MSTVKCIQHSSTKTFDFNEICSSDVENTVNESVGRFVNTTEHMRIESHKIDWHKYFYTIDTLLTCVCINAHK